MRNAVAWLCGEGGGADARGEEVGWRGEEAGAEVGHRYPCTIRSTMITDLTGAVLMFFEFIESVILYLQFSCNEMVLD